MSDPNREPVLAEQRKRTKQVMPGAVALVVESRRQSVFSPADKL
jgi:hypothetical protein